MPIHGPLSEPLLENLGMEQFGRLEGCLVMQLKSGEMHLLEL